MMIFRYMCDIVYVKYAGKTNTSIRFRIGPVTTISILSQNSQVVYLYGHLLPAHTSRAMILINGSKNSLNGSRRLIPPSHSLHWTDCTRLVCSLLVGGVTIHSAQIVATS